MNPLLGRTLAGRYRVESAVGRGGMAEVYKVFDTDRSVHLAMKLLREDLADDKVFVRRFKREAKTLAALQHPNIVRFYGLEQHEYMVFMIMDFVEGTSLRREIRRSDGPMATSGVLEIVKSICAALGYAHSRGMVHCDVKPGNIMIENTGRVLVTDFGIARMTDSATSTMVGIGTPAYMAPEMVLGQDPIPQSDIYSLGVVLFEMLTGGERPFTGENARTRGTLGERVRWEQLHLDPPSPRQWNRDIPPRLEAVILKCLAKEPQERFRSALELQNALVTATGEAVTETAIGDRPRKPARKEPLPVASSPLSKPRASRGGDAAAADPLPPVKKTKTSVWVIAIPILVIVVALGALFISGGIPPSRPPIGERASATPIAAPTQGIQASPTSEPTSLPTSEPTRDLSTILPKLATNCTYNAYRTGWFMGWADAGNIVDRVFGPGSPSQSTFWQVTYPQEAAAFEALAVEAYHNSDPVSRATTWQDAENMLVEELVIVIPLFHYDRTALVSTDVRYRFPPFGGPRIAQWSSKSGATTFRAAVGTAIPTLDVSQGIDVTSSYVISQLFDAPYGFNPDGTISPLSATGFSTNEEGDVFTIRFRRDALWSDGVPVTAQHFADGIHRALDPDAYNDYAYVMFDIVGAVDFNSDSADSIEGIRVIDDYTLEIRLRDALSYFDSIMAMLQTFHPVRLDLIEAMPGTWTQAGNLVGNGAYMLTEHTPGENLVLEKNPLYWNADNVTYEIIEVAIIENPDTCLAAFENNQLDHAACGLPAEDIPRLVDSPEFVVTPGTGTHSLGVNTVAQHTDNVNFRKALASAIDKRTLLDEILMVPWREEAWGVVPPEIYGYQAQDVGYGFDVYAAQSYLETYMLEAGIEDAGDIVIQLWYNTGAANQALMEAIEDMWETNLGIDVRTVSLEWDTYIGILAECNAIAQDND